MTSNSPTPGIPAPILPAPGFRLNPRVAARIALLLAIICPSVIVTDLFSPRKGHPAESPASTTQTQPAALSLPGGSP